MNAYTGVIKTEVGEIEMIGEYDQCKRWLNRHGFETNGAFRPAFGKEYCNNREFLYLALEIAS